VIGLGAEGAPRLLLGRDEGPGAEDKTVGVFAPEGVALGAGRLAVADTGNRRALLVDVQGASATVVIRERLLRPMDVAFLAPGATFPEGALAVLDGDTARVEVFGLDGTWLTGFGEWGYFPGLFAAPQGLATFGDTIFVADTDNHRIQAFAPSVRSRPEAPQFAPQYTFGVHAIEPGEGDGSLHYPSDVAIAPDGSAAAVSEPLDGRVQRFLRAPGAEPPVDPQRLGIGQASAHYGRVADLDGQFFVIAEPESRQVKLFDLRGEEPVQIGLLGGHGERLGMLIRPSGLALDSDRRELLVADAALRRVSRARLAIDPAEALRYNPARETWVEAIDFTRLGAGVLDPAARPIEPGELDRLPDGGAVLVDMANGRVLELGPDLLPRRILLAREAGLLAPADVALEPGGTHVLVTDAAAGAVFRVALGAQDTGATPPERLELRRPVRPENIHAARDGRVLVSDVIGHRIRVLRDVDGSLREMDAIGAAPWVEGAPPGDTWRTCRGLAPLWFDEPADLGVDARGRLLVVDHGNHRGVILGPDGEVLLGFGSRLYTRPLQPKRIQKPDATPGTGRVDRQGTKGGQ